jgi:GTP-binding protein LepA
MPNARIPEVSRELEALFGMDPSTMLHISAKANIGIDTVLKAVIERIPPPRGDPTKPLKALMFDSW